MSKIKIASAFALVFQIALSYGQSEEVFLPLLNVPKFKAEISQSAATTESIRATFVQEKHLKMLKDNLISEGTLLYKKPDLIKWTYTKPFDYIVVLKGATITIKDDGKTSTMDLSASGSFSELSKLMASAISGNVMDETRFDIRYDENKAHYRVSLQPKDQQLKMRILRIEMYISKSDKSVDMITLTEPGEDYTRIKFKNKILNAAISDADFKLP